MLLFCRSEDFFNVEARRFEDIVSCAFVVDDEEPLDLVFVVDGEEMSDAFVDNNDDDGVVFSLDGGAFIVDDEEKLNVFVDDDNAAVVKFSNDGALLYCRWICC